METNEQMNMEIKLNHKRSFQIRQKKRTKRNKEQMEQRKKQNRMVDLNSTMLSIHIVYKLSKHLY